MSRTSVPKYKVDRRLGVNLWGRAKSPFNTRPTKPGQHGKSQKRRSRLSNYGLQLAEKQKLQFYYGMKEKQFRIFFIKSSKSKGNVAQEFIAMLESRLDAVVYRAKWAPTIFASKQLIKHKHILVNGKVTSVSSYLVKPGDVLTLKDTIRDHAIIQESIALPDRVVPNYFEVTHEGKEVKVIKLPAIEEVPYPISINSHLVIEYYSRKI